MNNGSRYFSRGFRFPLPPPPDGASPLRFRESTFLASLGDGFLGVGLAAFLIFDRSCGGGSQKSSYFLTWAARSLCCSVVRTLSLLRCEEILTPDALLLSSYPLPVSLPFCVP